MILLGATPIGNLGDVTARLRAALETVQVIAAEDTRTVRRLLQGLGIANRPRLIALHEYNEREKAAEIVQLAREQDVLVLSDAGMPTVSDPGFRLVREAAASEVLVTVLPGPSAVLAGLALSGLPTDRFTFEGFLPRKPGELQRALEELAGEPRTMVFFEAPSRLAKTLSAMAIAFGPRRAAAVCRELTKLHEEVRRGPLAQLVDWSEAGVRGEICVVVAGAPARKADPESAVAEVLGLVAGGLKLKDAASQVGAVTGLSTRALYEGALKARSRPPTQSEPPL